jgi:ABC-type phosphate transport system substrate-binding protein
MKSLVGLIVEIKARGIWVMMTYMVASATLLSAQGIKPVIRYEGSSTIANFIRDAEEVYGEVAFTLITSTESEGGEVSIINGLSDIGGVARVPNADVLEKGVNNTLIGWDGIAVVVNAKNSVDNLTQGQLKDIFSGKIVNWKDVGGADLAIHPYIVGFESATRKVFRSVILGDSEYTNCNVSSPDVNILVDVNNDPGAIGQISFSFLSNNDFVKPIAVNGQEPLFKNRDYPITRPLYLLWWGRNQIRDFVDWTISPEGQAVVQRRFITAFTDTDIASDFPTIKYVGSSTVGIFMQNAAAVYRKANFELHTETESSGGEAAIVNQETDLAGIARLPDPSVLKAGVVPSLIARDAIAVIVHGGNNVHNLTTDQLKSIFTGQITNWRELGGENLTIEPYVVSSASATQRVFKEKMLGNTEYAGCREINPDPAIIDAVANNPGAIGHISNAFISRADHIQIVSIDGQRPGTTNLNYPISRPLYLLWNEGDPKVDEFISWTHSNEAQQLIMQHFIGSRIEGIPVRSGENGTLVVYTETSPVEDGGAYFYPHLPYEIFDADGVFVRRVRNSLNSHDETPDQVDLSPGNYLIHTSGTRGQKQEFFINIEGGKVTTVNVEEIDQSGLIDQVKVAEESQQRDRQISNVVSRFKSLQLYGDFRFRGELDWSSRRPDGTFRTDRTRLRYRLRFGFAYALNDHISFGARFRTGDPKDQQSPHVTLGSEFETPSIKLDKAYVKGNHGNFWWWGGKNTFPFWKQNELWWDDDVNPEGVALGTSIKLSDNVRLKPTAGYFVIYSRGGKLSDDPSMLAGQLALDIGLGRMGLTVASGYYGFNDIPTQSDDQGTHAINYQLINSGIKIAMNIKVPVTLGIDMMTNLEDYSTDSLISASGLANDKTGWVFSAQIGKLQKKGNVLLGYYYSYIQKYSVVDFFAQDDWVRWSFTNSTGTRSSNFNGHEFRLGYAFGSGFTVISRVYLVDGINKGHREDTTTETGNRFRIDLNIKF